MTQKKLMQAAEARTADVQTEIANIRRVMFVLVAAVLLFALILQPAFAGSGDTIGTIEDGVRKGLGEVYKIMSAIVIPIACLAFGFAAFKIFTGGEKGMQTAKMTILYTIIGLVIVYAAPVVIQQVSDWAKSSFGQTDVFG